MSNKFGLILLALTTGASVHAGWRRTLFREAHKHEHQVTQRDPEIMYLIHREVVYKQADKRFVEKQCRSAERLRVGKSLMKIANGKV